jgi:hypothetical protein
MNLLRACDDELIINLAVLGDDLRVPCIHGQLRVNHLLSNISGDADVLFVFVLIGRRH